MGNATSLVLRVPVVAAVVDSSTAEGYVGNVTSLVVRVLADSSPAEGYVGDVTSLVLRVPVVAVVAGPSVTADVTKYVSLGV